MLVENCFGMQRRTISNCTISSPWRIILNWSFFPEVKKPVGSRAKSEAGGFSWKELVQIQYPAFCTSLALLVGCFESWYFTFKKSTNQRSLGLKCSFRYGRTQLNEGWKVQSGIPFFRNWVSNLQDVNLPRFRILKNVLRTHALYANLMYLPPGKKSNMEFGPWQLFWKIW